MRPLIQLKESELDPNLYTKVEVWDPEFWTKVTHVVAKEGWSKGKEGVEFESSYSYYRKNIQVFGQLEEGQGYVYVLECKSQPGICKIGSTIRTPEQRCREINRATGIIVGWTVSAAFRCQVPERVERAVHEELKEVRINPQKEGFFISLEEAKAVIQRIIKAKNADIKI